MKKLTVSIFSFFAILVVLTVFPAIGHTQYPYPQNYLVDQRRFDTQQANNLVMRRLQSSTTGQWAIGVVSLDNYSGAVSTASYGAIISTFPITTTIWPGYAVKKWTVYNSGALSETMTNKSDGILYLDNGMSFEQVYDFPVSSFSFTIDISTGYFLYAITGVK